MTAETPVATTETPTPEPDGQGEVSPGAESTPAASDLGEVPTEINEAARKWAEGLVEKRAAELTKLRRDAEREREYWREEAMRGQARQQQPAPVERVETPVDEPIKTLADFQYDEAAHAKYMRDLARSEVKREIEGFRTELREGQTKAERQATVQDFVERAEAWAREQKLEKAELMFASPAEGGPAVSDEMAEVMIASEHGAAILNYLARNVAESRRIHKLPPLQQARELGKLEVKLASAPQPNKVSGAPPPAPRIDGGGAVAGNVKADTPDSDTMSDADWAKARKKQLEGRRLAARRT